MISGIIDGIDSVNFVLDAEGRILQIPHGDTDTLTFSYDIQNRLAHVIISESESDRDSIYIEYANTPTATSEITVTKSVKVFPNPSSSCFTIASDIPLPISFMEIYSIYGKRLFYKDSEVLNSTICLNEFPDGLYFVVFRDVYGRIVGETSKIQIEK